MKIVFFIFLMKYTNGGNIGSGDGLVPDGT